MSAAATAPDSSTVTSKAAMPADCAFGEKAGPCAGAAEAVARDRNETRTVRAQGHVYMNPPHAHLSRGREAVYPETAEAARRPRAGAVRAQSRSKPRFGSAPAPRPVRPPALS